jgi:hypothetical protein
MIKHMAIPEKIQQLIRQDSDPTKKMMAAKGLLPVPPPIQLEVLGVLLHDTDEKIRAQTQQTIKQMPANIIEPLLGKLEQPKLLHYLALLNKNNLENMSKILLNPKCSHITLEAVALDCDQRLTTIIANNQVKLLAHPKIAENLKKNPNTLRADMEKVLSFLKLNGISLMGQDPELTLAEIEMILALPDDDLPENLMKDHDTPPDEKTKQSIYQQIQDMIIGQKIKLALKGNKEARSILVKDSNKIVASGVIKNPRVTDGEVLSFCQNRSIQEEILRIICMNPQWVRSYSIQCALANNPKTPLQHAIRFTKMLNIHDLKRLSKNKNASAQLQKLAKTMFNQRRK